MKESRHLGYDQMALYVLVWSDLGQGSNIAKADIFDKNQDIQMDFQFLVRGNGVKGEVKIVGRNVLVKGFVSKVH